MMGFALALSVALTSARAQAACAPEGPSADSYVTTIRWSGYCFVGADQMDLAVLTRVDRVDGSTVYQNLFRGRGGVPLIGTYSNDDPAVFKAALDILNATSAESIHLKERAYLDGCASYLSITRGGRTLIISELQMDYDDPQYKRLEVILHRLTATVLTFQWKKESDRTTVWPLMLDELDQPGSRF
jgi:hypothetical protein